VSPGVKVTLSLGVPAPGAVVEVVHEKEPDTEAEPPVNVDEASVWPYVMALAVGHAVTVGVVFEVVPPPLLPPHPAAQKLARMPSKIDARRPIIFMSQPLSRSPLILSALALVFFCPIES
jgi:hypothetical protein